MSMSTTFRSTAERSGFCDCRKRRFGNSNMPLAGAGGFMKHSSTLTASKHPPIEPSRRCSASNPSVRFALCGPKLMHMLRKGQMIAAKGTKISFPPINFIHSPPNYAQNTCRVFAFPPKIWHRFANATEPDPRLHFPLCMDKKCWRQ